MADDKKIQALYNTFTFVGELTYNDDKFYKTEVSAGGYKYSSVQLGVKTAEGNVVYTQIMGGFYPTKKNVIKSMDKDKNKMEIDFNDRLDQKIVDTVADFKKLKVNFTSSEEKDSKVFLSEYDVAEYIKANVKKGLRVVVLGNVVLERYKDNQGKVSVSMKFNPTKIRLAKDDEKNKAELKLNFVFDKESLDVSRLAKEGKIDVTGFFTSYHKESRSQIFVQYPMLIDINYLASISTVPLDDAKKGMLAEMLKGYLKANTGEFIETEWRADLFKGTQQEEITLEDLSAEEKAQIEFGMVTLEQLAKEKNARKNGDKINEIRLVRPTMKYIDDNDVAKVNQKTELTDENFIIPEVKVEDKTTAFENNNSGETTTPKDEASLLQGLFG